MTQEKSPSARITARYIPIVNRFAPRNDVRFYLNGIRIEPNAKKRGGGIVLVGTDGHRLLAIHDADGFASRAMTVRFSSRLIAECGKNARRRSALDRPGHVEIDGDLARLVSQYDEDEPESRTLDYGVAQPVSGKYPDWRSVIPTPTDQASERLSFNFNPRYLADFAGINGQSWDAVKALSCGGEDAPVTVFIESMPEAIGVVMPMRVHTDAQVPQWAASAKSRSSLDKQAA